MEEKKMQDSKARHAYMLAWRDRMIEKQRAIIQGQGEEILLLEALLSFALGKAAGVGVSPSEAETKEHRTRIPKEELRGLLGKWESAVEDDGEHYVVNFVRRLEAADGQDNEQGAD